MLGLDINTEARNRLLDAAEKLFAQKGYNSVSVREIAKAVGLHHTTLYHHVPEGKEQLFVEVIERNLKRHHAGITEAIAQAGEDARACLQALARWLLSQPPLDMVRLVNSDMPNISQVYAERLTNGVMASVLSPVKALLLSLQAKGELAFQDSELMAGAFVGMVEALYAVPDHLLVQPRLEMAFILIDSWLTGLRPR